MYDFTAGIVSNIDSETVAWPLAPDPDCLLV